MNKSELKEKKSRGLYVPIPAIVLASIGVAGAIVNFACIKSSAFADFVNRNISCYVRWIMAALSSWIPFSLAEFLLLASPVILVILVCVCLKKSARGKRYFVRCMCTLLSVLLFVYGMFVFSFGAGYRTPTLDKKLGLTQAKVSAQDLYDTMNIVIDELNALCDDVVFATGKGSVRPYSHDECVRLCTEAYAALSDEYGFIPKMTAPVKQITLSEYLTYTHISGIYTFFTGEANLNTNYPYFVNVYSTAHEMAHQRGIARENEANFIAFLVCTTSDDPYMRYAGYLNMYEYLASPLYSASKDLYRSAVNRLDERARYDLVCYGEFFEKYRTNKAAEVSNKVNNNYLVSQGSKEGTKSYGMVVDLAVAYYKAR
ncbi:MAG: DUF3810 domain-containing protein [Clostridia bacterium]|nr:DUF3810 domain-containing protein [Clostridia bacterium]